MKTRTSHVVAPSPGSFSSGPRRLAPRAGSASAGGGSLTQRGVAWLRILGPIVLGGIFLLLVLALQGCEGASRSSLRPDYLEAAYVHRSQPFAGQGAPPWGDHWETEETTMDGIEAVLRWERGPLFFDAGLGYMVWYRNVGAGPWMAVFRVGGKWGIP